MFLLRNEFFTLVNQNYIGFRTSKSKRVRSLSAALPMLCITATIASLPSQQNEPVNGDVNSPIF
jgi:hypothetical protein